MQKDNQKLSVIAQDVNAPQCLTSIFESELEIPVYCGYQLMIYQSDTYYRVEAKKDNVLYTVYAEYISKAELYAFMNTLFI